MQIKDDFSSYINGMNAAQLKDYIKTVGKAANERLRALERSGLQNSSASYRFIKAQSRDADSAMGYTKKGQMKFNVATRAVDVNELRHRAAMIEKFMNAKSSTVTGTKAIYKQAYDTFEKNHPDAKITFKEFAEGMSYGLIKHFGEIYGSEMLVELHEKSTGMTSEEVEECLLAGGFTMDTTQENAPYVYALFAKIEDFQANKRSMNNDTVTGFDDDSML